MRDLYFGIIVFFLFTSCTNQKPMEYLFYQGPIQGTMFNITYEWNKDLAHEIDSLLQNFNKSLSNYDSTSTVSMLNQNKTNKTDELFDKMWEISYEVFEETNGAFDITIAPIVNEWGFGWIKRNAGEIPDSALILSKLQYVGMNKINLKNSSLTKLYKESMIITNAVAQGLSVDYIADYFLELGLKNFLIEIGGEIYCHGANNRGEKWRIGIDKPIEGSGYDNRENQIILSLSGKAVATSGNYRKYIEDGGTKIGHSIDPRTGFPAQNSLLSVTVVSESCALSDAYATAFMVSGFVKSYQIACDLKSIEAYFIYVDENGIERFDQTPGFSKLLIEE